MPSLRNYLRLQWLLQNKIHHTRELFQQLHAFFSSGTRDEIYPLFLPSIKTPIYLRRNTSDFSNFLQLFINQEYAQCFHHIKPKVIMDLGAYIGLSSLYFANRFPNAKIICVEPEADNYQLLKLNSRPYPHIIALQAGIWSHKTRLKIVRQAGGDWGNIVAEASESDSNTINALAINDLVELYEIDSIDFLKVDIEGSEKQIFSYHTDSWIDRVLAVACETHDRFIPGCTEAYEQLFSTRGFNKFQSGEFSVFIKQDNLL